MKNTSFLLFILLSVAGYAQPGNRLSLSLQQAIDMGLKNRYDIQSQRYNTGLASNAVTKAKKQWIPEITGNADLTYNTQLQSTVIPGEFFGETGPVSVTIGSKNVSVFGLNLNQTIFKPGIGTDVKIARNDMNLQKEKIREDEMNIRIRISEAYLDVLLKELQYKIAYNSEQRYKEYFDLAEGRYKQGALLENDYLRSRLDYDNARVQTATVKQNYGLATDNLKYQINISEETAIVLSDSLGSGNFESLQQDLPATGAGRTELKQLELQQMDNQLQLRKVRQNAMPEVSFIANYSRQFLNQDFNYEDSKSWGPFSYLGLRVSIPITSNFGNRNNIREYSMKSQQTDLQLKQKTMDIRYDIQKATAERDNASKNMQSSKLNYELANTIYQNQKRQYALGAFEYDKLLDTEKTLSTAEQNYIRAVYDYLISGIAYQKATGSL